MFRALPLAAALLLLAACGQASGAGSSGTGSPTDLPSASVDGVGGQAVSYCWRTTCADGFPTSSAPPAATRQTLRIGAETSRVEIFVRRGPVTAFQQSGVAVSSDGRLGAIPGGQWDYLLAMVTFRDGGSAMYAWS
ncbi:MAG: hypothetical protein ACR2KI_07270, partial [Candidatus Limnocylindria bacterium]